MKKRLGSTVESPSRNILHFTNREDEQQLFARMLAQREGGHLPVLSFYGVGGTGKSWLLHKLRGSLPSAGEIPYAHLDFAIDRGGELYQRDPAAAMAEIQRQLGVECPRFEVAYHVMLWKQGKRDTPDSPVGEAASTGWQIAIALGQDAAAALVPGMNVAGKVLEKLGSAAGRKLQGTALGKWLEERGSNAFLKQLLARTAQEISTELVYHLAADLHEQLPARTGRQCRALLFFDTFEDLVRGTGRGDTKERATRQQWIQELYRALLDDAEEPRGTVLFVVAGRDRLVWHEDFDDPCYLDQHRVGGLSRRDACRFLESCGIEDAALQEAILRVSTEMATEGARDNEHGYHPFSLGLCADTVVSDRARGRDPEAASFSMSPGDVRELVERFLASFDGGQEAYTPWMYKLALPPRWDEQAARQGYSPVDDAQQDAAWDALTSYSFVQPPSADEPWWGLHTRMRDALRARHAEKPERVRRDHEFWRDHWHGRSERPADVYGGLAWYHTWCLDPEAALKQWRTLIAESKRTLRMAEHFDLIGWWAPTSMMDRAAASDPSEAMTLVVLADELHEASLGTRSTNLQKAIACYEAALQLYTEEALPQQWAATMNNLGIAYRDLLVGDRAANLQLAIQCFEAALRVFTEDALPQVWSLTMNNLGNIYSDLPVGDRDANVKQAIRCYEAALQVQSEEALPQQWAMTMNNLGIAYSNLLAGDRAANLQQAIQCYEAALRIYTEEALPQDWAMTMNNLGRAYQKLPAGDRDANLKQAIQCYEAALRVFTENALPQRWAGTMNNLGSAYSDLPVGDRAANLQQAIQCYEAALRIRTEDALPQDWARTMNNLGNAYSQLPVGDRAFNLQQAIACYEAVLRIYTEEALPQDWASTMHNLGIALVDLAIQRTPDVSDAEAELFRAHHREIHQLLARARGTFVLAERGYRRVGLEDTAQEVAGYAEHIGRQLTEAEQ